MTSPQFVSIILRNKEPHF